MGEFFIDDDDIISMQVKDGVGLFVIFEVICKDGVYVLKVDVEEGVYVVK